VSINWSYLQHAAQRLLPLVFLPLSAADAVFSVTGRWLGTDGHLYYEASAAWLSGGNPWDVFVTNRGLEYHYYALPTAAVLIAPFTKIPEDLFVAIWIGIQVVAAVYVVWRLKLQWWWLAFPPLVDGILAGNPSPLVIALLVAPHPAAKAFAVLLKVYAGLPLLGERKWRAVLIAAGIVVASVHVSDTWPPPQGRTALCSQTRTAIRSSGWPEGALR